MKTISKFLMIIMLLFTTSAFAASAVNLGTAGNFTVLAKTGISTVGTTSIVGDIGVSPAPASYITGFGLIMDPSVQWSTSSLVSGKVYASDYTPPTPSDMSVAIGDMQVAYTDAAGRAPNVTELGAGDISGMTLVAGVYKWSTNLLINTNVTLTGSNTDIWIFEVAQNFDISSGQQVVLSGGALAKNIFWQVAGQATLGTTSIVNGNILCQTAIVMNTGATLNGKALAQSAVTLDANTVVSSNSVIIPYPTLTPTPTITSTPSISTCNKNFYVFPSPVRGNVLNVDYNMCENGKFQIRIYNENADLVANVTEQKMAGNQISQIPTGNFASGIYIYKIVLTYNSGRTDNFNVSKFAVAK